MHAAACWEVLNQKTRDVNSCHSPNPSHLEKWVVGDRRGWTVFGMIQVKVLSFLARKILDHRNFSTLQNFKLIPAPLWRRSQILNYSSTDLDAFNLYSYHFFSFFVHVHMKFHVQHQVALGFPWHLQRLSSTWWSQWQGLTSRCLGWACWPQSTQPTNSG